MNLLNTSATRAATRLSFFVAGFGLACWAPLVPLIKAHLQLDAATLGVLLLCMGTGSVTAMLATGALSARYGSKAIIVVSGIALTIALPLLPLMPDKVTLALALVVFGASLGSLDVAMNLYAAQIERAGSRPMMSGFHALFSVGGFAGAAMMTLMLAMHISALYSTLIAAVIMAVAMYLIQARLVHVDETSQGPLFAMPRGIVLVLAVLAGVTFLVEGAILDWGGVLITDAGLVATTHGGIGYMLFSVAMLTGRFTGDAVCARLGDRLVMLWGGILAITGILTVITAPAAWLALAGFVFIGIGASNIVPVLFRLAGAQRVMAPGLAIAAISTVGYAGVLVGPAGIGFIAKHASLPMAFGLLSLLLCAVPACAFLVTSQAVSGKKALS